MPTYEYRCKECSSQYEVFHKVREVENDVVCPACGSSSHLRLMSLSGMSMNSYSSSASSSYNSADSCSSGSCCGGSCNIN